MEFFSIYDTTRFVRIRSRRLGFLWWGLALAVLLWAGASVVVFRSFRTLEPLSSFVDVTLQEDTERTPSCGALSGCVVEGVHAAVAHREKSAIAITLTEKRIDGTKVRVESAPLFKLEHAVFSDSESEFHANARAMQGRVVDKEGKTIQFLPPGKADHVSLARFLEAAGVNLDEKSDVPGEEEYTVRERGVHLIVRIFYSNVDDSAWLLSNVWGQKGELEYVISARRVLSSQYKWEDGQSAKYAAMIHIRSTGERVVFAGWGAILTTLAQGVSLITVSSLLVDYLAIYVLREKKMLYPLKFGAEGGKEKTD